MTTTTEERPAEPTDTAPPWVVRWRQRTTMFWNDEADTGEPGPLGAWVYFGEEGRYTTEQKDAEPSPCNGDGEWVLAADVRREHDQKAAELAVEAAAAAEQIRATEAAAADGEIPSTAAVARIDTNVRATSEGFLALRPGQTRFDEDQRAALAAIVNFDPERRPGSAAHIKVFAHLCQARGLDPYAREAYLIERNSNTATPTYTMQVGIDGFRKMARRTGRFIRRVGWYWTGAEDADNPVESRWWFWNPDEGAFSRVWLDAWLLPDPPAAAKCVIEHYDDSGNVVRTPATVNWTFMAPEHPAWHWGEKKGEKVYEKNPDGTQKMALAEMWDRGGPHMLAKCAEAQAIRTAFPAEMSGIYTHEEMHHLDVEEQQRRKEAQDARRRARYEAAQAQRGASPNKAEAARDGAPITVIRVTPEPPAQPNPESEDSVGPLLPVGEAVQDVVDGIVDAEVVEEGGDPFVEPGALAPPGMTDDEKRAALITEAEAIARVMGTTPGVLLSRAVKMHGDTKPTDWPVDDLVAAVFPFRAAVANVLHNQGKAAEADAYRAYGRGEIVTDLASVGLAPQAP